MYHYNQNKIFNSFKISNFKIWYFLVIKRMTLKLSDYNRIKINNYFQLRMLKIMLLKYVFLLKKWIHGIINKPKNLTSRAN